jgi:alkylation response protein AidB-like acyl-CoA dehydrogenase
VAREAALLTPVVKAFGTQKGFEGVNAALQVFGGYGYSREYPAERFYRDARFVGFGEGDAATLIGTIAKDLG